MTKCYECKNYNHIDCVLTKKNSIKTSDCPKCKDGKYRRVRK